MKKFSLLKATRQSTEYSCGASALQAVLSYWGKDLDEDELIKLLHTTPETGTYPEDIERVARVLGFEDHWHTVMGGDLEKTPKLMRLGIFIRGEKPAQPQRFKDVDISKLDFSKIGSLNLIVTQFPGALLPYDFVNELRDIWETGIIRPDAFIILRKDQEGRITSMEGGLAMSPNINYRTVLPGSSWPAFGKLYVNLVLECMHLNVRNGSRLMIWTPFPPKGAIIYQHY